MSFLSPLMESDGEFSAHIYSVEKFYVDLSPCINDIMLCTSCASFIKDRKQRPPLSKIKLNVISDRVKNLTDLEERLISPRLAFMHITLAIQNQNMRLRGNITNVPADLSIIQRDLPRFPDEASTLAVELRKQLLVGSPYMTGSICPTKTLAALHSLEKTPLYISEGVKVRADWLRLFGVQQSNIDKANRAANAIIASVLPETTLKFATRNKHGELSSLLKQQVGKKLARIRQGKKAQGCVR